MKIKVKFVLWGSFGYTNLGDDLLLSSFITLLKNNGTPLTDIAVRVRNKSEISFINQIYPGIITFTSTDKIECSKLIFAGGTQFFSFPNERKGLSKILSNILNSFRLMKQINFSDNYFQNVFFKSAGAFSVGLGPFTSKRITLFLVKQWLKKLDVVVTRDHVSTNNVIRINKINNMKQDCDIVYNQKLWFPNKFNTRKRPMSKKKKIGFILRDWRRGNISFNYLTKIINFYKVYCKKFDVVFFVFSPYDSRVIDCLENESLEFNLWKGNESSLEKYMQKLSYCDVIVSARAHGVVLANILKIPSISIDLDPKISLISEEFNQNFTQPVWTMPFESKDLNDLILSSIRAKIYGKNKIGETLTNSFNEFINK